MSVEKRTIIDTLDTKRTTAQRDSDAVNIYERISENSDGPFYKRSVTEIYLASMAIGYHYKLKKPLGNHKVDAFVVNLLKDNNAKWLMKSIAISEMGIQILKDPTQITKICNEYANGGIYRLKAMYDDSENPTETIALIMDDILNDEISEDLKE